jgi:nucleoid DNA-binding protein
LIVKVWPPVLTRWRPQENEYSACPDHLQIEEGEMSETTTKPMTRTEMIASLANSTGLTKQQVSDFFEELVKLIADQLKEGGPGAANIGGLMKVKVIRKPAQAERKGVNPFTKEETVFKAKPAQNVLRITPLKKLKDSV